MLASVERKFTQTFRERCKSKVSLFNFKILNIWLCGGIGRHVRLKSGCHKREGPSPFRATKKHKKDFEN